MNSPSILLIIPAYNESETIVSLVKKITDYKEKSNLSLEYIVINDGSTDNEEEILTMNHINHIELIQNLGIGGAVQTGYKYALEHDYDIAVQFDGDGQHDIESLPNLIAPLLSGEADLVTGSRFIEKKESNFQSSFSRRLGIRLISSTVKMVSGLKIFDITSGYRAGNRAVIAQFANRYPSKYPEPESYIYLFKQGFKVKEVPAQMFERQAGTSSIGLFSAVLYMIDVLLSVLIASFVEGEK